MKTVLSRIALLILALVLGTELAVRLSGIVDVPVYHVDDEIGFVPKPNQAGSFLHRNHWAFNDRSMGTALPWSTSRPNILLIGNSVVMGGNAFDQKDKLGPLIQGKVGDAYAVWPVAVGGWTNVNEMVYLMRHPDVVSHSQYFVWEVMNGGLSQPGRWTTDFNWPRERPIWASWYVFERYIRPRLVTPLPSELPPVGAADPRYVAQFRACVAALRSAADGKHPGFLFLYPTLSQYLAARHGEEWLPERGDIERIAHEYDVGLIDIATQSEWNESLYRDPVHPSVAGNQVLAKILAAAIEHASSQASP